jgi:hypothetical protein
LPNYTLDGLQANGQSFVLQYLLPIVAANSTITYGHIAKRLQVDLRIGGRVFPTHVGGVVGALVGTLQERISPDIPLINVLVVDQDTGAPGDGVDGFLRDRYRLGRRRMTEVRKTELVAQAAHEVYAYSVEGWSDVYLRCFGGPAPAVEPVTLIAGSERDGNELTPIGKRGGEAESIEHRALKSFVLENPHSVGIRSQLDRAQAELLLLSGDEVDVYFEGEDGVHLVEVKSRRSDWNDLQRGIYQCIKYREVFKAQRRSVMPNLNVVTTLAVETKPPSDIRELAKLHGVKLKVVDIS